MAAHPRPGEDAWFRALVDSAKDFAILSLDSEGNIVTWNEGARRLFGFREDEVLGKPSSLIFTPEDQAISASERELHNAAREGRAHDDRWHVRRDGSHLWASGLLLAMRDDDGIVRGFVKIVQDKTDARRLEETLRASEEQFARVFLGNPAAITLERADTGAFALANERFFELIGHWRSEVMGRSGVDLGFWNDPSQREDALKQVGDGGVCDSARVDVRAKDGAITRCVATFRATDLQGVRYVLSTYIPLPPEG